MIEAHRTSRWRRRYDVVVDGRRVATWDASSWASGGTVELDGRRYQVRSNVWGSTYGMVDEQGALVAAADRVGRKDWTIKADGTTYRFHRPSVWRHEEELQVQGQRAGSVRRTSVWRSDAVADLPGLPLPVAVFVLAVVLARWDAEAAAAG